MVHLAGLEDHESIISMAYNKVVSASVVCDSRKKACLLRTLSMPISSISSFREGNWASS